MDLCHIWLLKQWADTSNALYFCLGLGTYSQVTLFNFEDVNLIVMLVYWLFFHRYVTPSSAIPRRGSPTPSISSVPLCCKASCSYNAAKSFQMQHWKQQWTPIPPWTRPKWEQNWASSTRMRSLRVAAVQWLSFRFWWRTTLKTPSVKLQVYLRSSSPHRWPPQNPRDASQPSKE